MKPDDYMQEIQQLLRRLGVSAGYNGFPQTAYAVQLSITDPDCLHLVTKLLYPAVAGRYGTTCTAAVTLELGGKSPCVIDRTANLKIAARRIVFGKYLNCGQTCVAPDYVLIEACVKDEFLKYAKEEMLRMYGEHPLDNPAYGKMVNQKHFHRVLGLIEEAKIVYGGENREDTLQIAPTILDFVTEEDAVMQEEIFGPVLPVLTVDSMDEAYIFVRNRPKPLAFYLFTEDAQTEQRFLKEVPFGGGCVNDTIIHLATPYMGFGGVGDSGMGTYHGKKSFETFSHEKSIVKKYNWIDLPMRYQPYSLWKQKLVKMFVK